ncbi:MAG: GH25 family lysozyme [Bacteroidota bacterium]
MKSFIKFLFILLGLIILLVCITVEITNKYSLIYPSKNKYPVQGIDVSHHQGLIRWDSIDTSKVKFVFNKATEGANFKDKRFKYNW